MKKILVAALLLCLLLPGIHAQVRLAFRPEVNGFHFTNRFRNNIDGVFQTDGLCGGMALAAFNYFRYGMPIPNITEPSIDYSVTFGLLDARTSGTTLLIDYLFHSQFATYINPRSLAFFGVADPIFDEEFAKIKARIDRGEYAILGLKMRPGVAGLGHQVLCYGYNLASRELYVYDSNFPDQEIRVCHDGQVIVLRNSTGIVSEKFKAFFEQQELFMNRTPNATRYTFDLFQTQNLAVRPPDGEGKISKEGFGSDPLDFNYDLRLAPQNVYKLQCLATSKMVEVQDGPIQGTRVQQFFNYERNGLVDGKNQQWLFIPGESLGPVRNFYILNYGFLKYLEAGSGVSVQNGNDNRNQRWYIQPSPVVNVYYIKSLATQRYLEMPTGPNNDGNEFVLRPFTGLTNQQFSITTYAGLTGPQNYTPGSFVSISSKANTGRGLNLPDASTNNGTALQLYDVLRGESNSQWQFIRTPDGYYKIQSRLGVNKVLDINGTDGSNHSNLLVWDNADVEKQKWLVIPEVRAPGNYIFFNKVSGTCMDVAGGLPNNHVAIQTFFFQNGNNQKWKVAPAN